MPIIFRRESSHCKDAGQPSNGATPLVYRGAMVVVVGLRRMHAGCSNVSKHLQPGREERGAEWRTQLGPYLSAVESKANKQPRWG